MKAQRLSGNHKFWTCRDVEVACRGLGFSSGMIEGIRGNLLKLELFGYLEAMILTKSGWWRAWRIKMKYVVKATGVVNVVKGEKV